MGFEVKKTTLDERKALIADSKVIAAVKKSGSSIGTIIDVEREPKFWAVNHREQAYFCLISTDDDRDSDGKWRFLLKLKNEGIVFELKGYNTVNFLHDSLLLQSDLPKIKALITEAFNVIGRWGDGDVDISSLSAVPNPSFEFDPGMGE